MSNKPLVSVVTPVYNGEQFLRCCIESVLAQTYDNWEYIILDNCSTDHTPQIIQEYGNAESRIKIYTNDELLPIMDNWNYALRKISANSMYCKIVHADDSLRSDCLNSMVEIGEKHPSAGIIGAFALWGNKVACDGIESDTSLISGQEICRRTLKREIYPFLSPSALMIRANLIHQRPNFYPGEHLEADVEVLYELLKRSDFGFVPKVLTIIGKHEDSATTKLAKPLNTLLPQKLKLLKKFGPVYLTDDEFSNELRFQLIKYYKYLARSIFKNKGDNFWQYHKNALKELNFPLSNFRLCIFLLTHWLEICINRLSNILTYGLAKLR